MSAQTWHLITGEYPPQPGGVSAYTQLLATRLAAFGDEVHVWCPGEEGETPAEPGITLHRELGRLGLAGLWGADRRLSHQARPRRIVLQWVPHAFGLFAMNIAICLWLWKRVAIDRDQLEIVAHEVRLDFVPKLSIQNVQALVQRLMVAILSRAASRVWVTIPAWEWLWRRVSLGKPPSFAWLPVPSNIQVVSDTERTRRLREQFANDRDAIVGHFGTYGGYITEPLTPVLAALLREDSTVRVLLIGRGSREFRERFLAGQVGLAPQVFATGDLNEDDLSIHLAACDVLVQPFPDGTSSRRTSVMAGLAHGRAIVTTTGWLTEPLWAEREAVALVPAGDVASMLAAVKRLLADDDARHALETSARTLYDERFDIGHTVDALRS
jgi:glycosyltransferase involved in cell wall biosynthesis